MKKIETMAEEAFHYDYNYTDKVPSNSESYRYGFEAGFRKAIEMAARVCDRGDGAMSSMSETLWCNSCRDEILKLGEEDA